MWLLKTTQTLSRSTCQTLRTSSSPAATKGITFEVSSGFLQTEEYRGQLAPRLFLSAVHRWNSALLSDAEIMAVLLRNTGTHYY